MSLTEEQKKHFYTGIRQFAYLIGCVLLMYLQHILAKKYQAQTFREGLIVEEMQVILLLISGCFFGGAAILKRQMRSISLFLSSLCFFASCRELDSWFDAHLPVISWKIGGVLVLAAVVFAIYNRQNAISEITVFLGSKTFCLQCNAIIIVLVIAQLIGHKPFLVNVLGEIKHIGDVKELYEECAESIGYFIILCSSIEYYFENKILCCHCKKASLPDVGK